MKTSDRPGPGKFEGNESLAVSETLYEIVNDGFADGEIGDVSTYGIWYGLILMPAPVDTREARYRNLTAPAYIANEDEHGFFGYTAYDSLAEAERDWQHLSHSFEAVDKIIANETEN